MTGFSVVISQGDSTSNPPWWCLEISVHVYCKDAILYEKWINGIILRYTCTPVHKDELPVGVLKMLESWLATTKHRDDTVNSLCVNAHLKYFFYTGISSKFSDFNGQPCRLCFFAYLKKHGKTLESQKLV